MSRGEAIPPVGAFSWRYSVAPMAVNTATIRVAQQTRDLLAAQAAERGLSLAAMLAEIADERRRQATWASEREAARIDADNPEARREIDVWEATLEDGVD